MTHTNGTEKLVNYKRRRKINRIKRWSALICLLSVGILCALFFAPSFQITAITVTGNEKIPTEEIVQASRIELGGNLFRANIGLALDNIRKITYTKDVTIKRRFPSTLQIIMTEHTPFGYIKAVPGFIYVAQGGEILEENEFPPPGITLEITGLLDDPNKNFEKNPKNFQKYLATVDEIVDNELLGKVTAINLYEDETIGISIKELRVFLGTEDDLEYKFSMLTQILEKLGNNPRGSLDMHDVNQATFMEEL